MKHNSFKIIGCLAIISMALQSCFKDLDRYPENQTTSANVYADFRNYKGVLAKCYAGLAVTGQKGPDGNKDIQGIDEGTSSYLRQYWVVQELPTDEAKVAWLDGTIQDYNSDIWTSGSEFVAAMYYRIFFQIGLCNEVIREMADSKLDERGITGTNKTLAQTYRNEARFLRALSYYHALDLFGNVPFSTENDNIAETLPVQIKRADLFNYVESELLDLSNVLLAPGTNEYGRADQAAAWMLLSKLYLNAGVYTETSRYDQALIYAEKVITQSGRTLAPVYANLFKADNHTSPETILSINFDGNKTRTWGGMTFLVHAAVGNDVMNPADFGISGGWAGIRTTENILYLFDSTRNDDRNMLQTTGFNRTINSLTQYSDGVGVKKYSNKTSTGNAGVNGDFVDTDFPLFRLAEAYLTYAECNLRGGGGSASTALGYINALRTRANSQLITSSQLTLDFILDERAREMLWECQRRTDLIRYGKFTSATYLWPFKGGVSTGTAIPDYRKIMPIPAADLNANPNLTQNPNY